MLVHTFPLILEQSYLLAPQVKHFVFRHEHSFHYIPGQFITLHFEHNNKTYKRSYSIANVPTNHNHLEFAASYVEGGVGSELLFSLKPGDQIMVNGPFGRLVLKEPSPERYILVATSTGVTPYRAMREELQQRLHAHPDLEVVIILGAKNREFILYHDEWRAWAQDTPRITFHACLSQEKTPLHAHEYHGYVQSIFPTLQLSPGRDLIYLCGNPGMIDDSFAELKTMGFESQHIIREKYISSK